MFSERVSVTAVGLMGNGPVDREESYQYLVSRGMLFVESGRQAAEWLEGLLGLPPHPLTALDALLH